MPCSQWMPRSAHRLHDVAPFWRMRNSSSHFLRRCLHVKHPVLERTSPGFLVRRAGGEFGPADSIFCAMLPLARPNTECTVQKSIQQSGRQSVEISTVEDVGRFSSKESTWLEEDRRAENGSFLYVLTTVLFICSATRK